MSSSNKTAAVLLNQWQRSDGVCMDDFNADNSKLDAAILALQQAVAAAPLVRIKDITTTQAAAQIDVDMSDIDPADYRDIIVCLKMKSEGYYTRVNNVSTSGAYEGNYGNSVDYMNYVGGALSGEVMTYLHLAVFNQAPFGISGRVEGFVGATSSNNVASSVGHLKATEATPLRSLNFIKFFADFKVGCNIAVYGMK